MKKALSVFLAVLLFFTAIPARADDTMIEVKMRLMDSCSDTPISEWFESSLLTACMCVYIGLDLSSTDGYTMDGVLPSNGLELNLESGCYALEQKTSCLVYFHLEDGRILTAKYEPNKKEGGYSISNVSLSTKEEFVSGIGEAMESLGKSCCYVPYEDLNFVMTYILSHLKNKQGIQ